MYLRDPKLLVLGERGRQLTETLEPLVRGLGQSPSGSQLVAIGQLLAAQRAALQASESAQQNVARTRRPGDCLTSDREHRSRCRLRPVGKHLEGGHGKRV